LGGPTSKERGREERGGEEREWEGRRGKGREREGRGGEGKERAMSPHYLEEVYAYANGT